jgi:hypothetical protein
MITSYYEALSFLFLLVVTLILTMHWGHRFGIRARKAGMDVTKGLGTTEGGVMGLLGLILAFTFFNEETRFERRIELIVEQVNSIGTAYDETSLFPEPARTEIRGVLREYVASHLKAFRSSDTAELRDPAHLRALQLHEALWDRYLRACKTVEAEYCANMLLPSLNRMEEAALSRLASRQTHMPRAVMILLLLLSACSGLISGFSMASHPTKQMRLHRLVYIISLAVTYFAIIDIEFPRGGFINVDQAVTPAYKELEHRIQLEQPHEGASG